MSRYSVRDKVALVTGGARGIGFETARQLRDAGAYVVIVDLEPGATKEAATSLGDRVMGLAADVTDQLAMEQVVREVVTCHGRLDIVVANAGIAPTGATIRTLQSAEFERVLDVNILGVCRTVQAALPFVVASGGHVVVVASVYSFVNGVLMTPYAMSKAAVEQYGRALRSELAQHGASATVAYFGFIDTDMVRNSFTEPLVKRLEETFPRSLRKRLPPSAAGAAIVGGIERRAPRVIAPKRWAAYSSLRGLLNPALDRRTERNAVIQGILRDADADADVARGAEVRR